MLPLWSFLCWHHNLVWLVCVYGYVCDDLNVPRSRCSDDDHACLCRCKQAHVYFFVCLLGVLQSQRYNGPTPSLCEVLQNNLKQSTAAGREPGPTFSWITSQGNSRYAISAAQSPYGYFQRPWPQHDWLDDVSVPATQEEQDPKPHCCFLLATQHFIPAALNSSAIVQMFYSKHSRPQRLCLQGLQFLIICPIETILWKINCPENILSN